MLTRKPWIFGEFMLLGVSLGLIFGSSFKNLFVVSGIFLFFLGKVLKEILR
jgi:uncharacterized membrane protein